MPDAVFIFPNMDKPQVVDVLLRVLDFFRVRQINIVLPDELADIYGEHKISCQLQEDPKGLLFALSLGGDGTLLRLVKRIAPYGVPVCGLNMGQLGFLTEIELPMLETKLTAILSGEYFFEYRSMIKACVLRAGKEVYCTEALNDIVIARGNSLQMLRLYVTFTGGGKLQYPVDGLIFATSTGSTGYSLSAGGSIIHPGLDVILLTPICAHALYARPLVVDFKEQMSVKLAVDNGEVVVSSDGSIVTKMLQGDEILISGSSNKVVFIRVDGNDYYSTWQDKLRRGEDSAKF